LEFKKSLDKQLAENFQTTEFHRGIEVSVLQEKDFEFEIIPSHLNLTQELQEWPLIFDANVSVKMSVEENQTIIHASVVPEYFKDNSVGSGDSKPGLTVDDLHQGKQIFLSLLTPPFLTSPELSKLSNPQPQWSESFMGTEKFTWDVQFGESSITQKFTIACTDTKTASAIQSLMTGYLGIMQLATSSEPSDFPATLLLSEIEVEQVLDDVVLEIEIKKDKIERIVAAALAGSQPELHPQVLNKPFEAMEGQLAPPFLVPLLKNGNFDLRAHRGRVVVLDFWATWCGPCIRGLPLTLDAIAEFSPKDVVYIAINQGEDPVLVQDFVDEYDMQELPIALDRDKQVGDLFRVKGMPHCVILDEQGVIRRVRVGFSPFQGTDLKRFLDRLIKGQD